MGTTPGGLPYPEPTAPFKDTPAALQALKTALTPKLANQALQFIPAATYSTDSNGDAHIDLSSRFTRIDGVVLSDHGGGYPSNYQVVTHNPATTVAVRVMTLTPPSGTVIANSSNQKFSMIVWGQPK